MKHPKIVTYACTLETLQLALDAHVDEIILEDPKLSLRTYEPLIKPGFEHLASFITLARQANPNIHLSFNLDILPHRDHDSLIRSLCTILTQHNVTTFRIQDPGLTGWIKTYIPTATFHYAPETSNQNLPSLEFYQTKMKRQVLSNEIAKADLATFRKALVSELEIQVHGPLLIQYSPRRYLSAIENTPSALIRLAADQDYPNRFYPFYDNPHGHLMYLYFDRCLLTLIPELLALNLDAWLIDGRGQSPDYLKTALALYSAFTLPTPENWAHLQTISPRPLKPGFFNANLTDQDRKTPWKDWAHFTHVGTLLDCSSPTTALMIQHQNIPPQSTLLCVTPKGKTIPFSQTECIPLSHPLTSLPFKKGLTAKSRVYLA